MPLTSPSPNQTAHFGYWLRYVSHHVSCALASKLAARGVTVAEWVMLRTLYGQEPMSPSRLADELGMTRGTITKLADQLIDKALVIRKASLHDGRAQTLALTRKGKSLAPELASLAEQNDAEFFNHLSGAERKTLEQLLKRIVKHGHITGGPID